MEFNPQAPMDYLFWLLGQTFADREILREKADKLQREREQQAQEAKPRVTPRKTRRMPHEKAQPASMQAVETEPSNSDFA